MYARPLGLLRGLLGLALGGLIGGACLALSLLPGKISPLLGFVPPVFVVFACEAGYANMRGSLRRQRAAGDMGGAAPLPQLGAWWSGFLIIEAIGALIAVAVVAAGTFAVFYLTVLRNGAAPTSVFWTQLAIYAIWLLVRWPAKALWLMNQRSAFPKLEVFSDHLVVTSHLVPLTGGLPRNVPITIGFSELEEVRAFGGYVEAQNFLQANTIPQVVQVQQLGQVIGFQPGASPRPEVTVLPLAAGTNVLLRGPSIFYLLAFDEKAAQGLVAAYSAFRRGAAIPAT